MTLEEETPHTGQKVSNRLLRKSKNIAPERMKRQGRNNTPLWMCLLVKVKPNANIA